ncbi:MAG: class I SAM-dependent methyltransferase [Flavobacteriales bacterium]|nr:class I SAM-dependent methyltransferase [Flavobacteriales bacterium]
MGNWHLAGPFLRLCLTQPKRVLKGLFHFTMEEDCRDHVIKTYGLAKGLPTIDIRDIAPDLDDTITKYTYLDGTSRVTDFALLRALAKRFPNGRYIEFGSWRGESLANVSPLMKEVIAMSFGAAEMKSIGAPDAAVRAAHLYSRNLPNIRIIEHNTQTYDFSALKGTCDMIFVDADHQYPGVTIDTRNAFTLLKDDKSIIVWHDYGLGYEKPNWQVFRGILDGAPSDEHRKRIYHVSNTLCAVYLPEAVKASYPEVGWPTKTFSVRITADKN